MQVLEKLALDPAKIRRVVIDAQIGQALVLYIEHYGDDRILSVEPPSPEEVIIKCES